MSKSNSTLTAERLREVLDYEPETGVFTRLVAKRGYRAGGVSGSIMKIGYVEIGVDGGRYLAHRLAWLWVYGVLPTGHIDHIDGDKSNNRITNLRDVERAVNMQNLRTARRDNTSCGLLGVHPNRKRWAAQIIVKGVTYHLGTFDTPEQAHQVYIGAKRLIHPGCTI